MTDQILTNRLYNNSQIARMAAETVADLDKVDRALELYSQWLLTEEEAIKYMG